MREQSKGFRPSSVAVVAAAILVSPSVLFAASPYGLGGLKTAAKTETHYQFLTTILRSSSRQIARVTIPKGPL